MPLATDILSAAPPILPVRLSWGAMKLSSEAWERARAHLMERARPIDRALFRFEFEGGDARSVREEIRHFQNEDGGFGRALEPDLRLPASSTLATSQALVHLRAVGTPGTDELVARALSWLVEAYDASLGAWRSVPREAEDHPHAKHWAWELHEDGKRWPVSVLPGAEVLASLHHYAALVPADWLAEIGDRFAADLAALSDRVGGDSLAACDGLVRSEATPAALERAYRDWMLEVGPKLVDRDPKRWSAYVTKPLKIAPRPDSVLAETLAADIERNLDFEIGQQQPDGSWAPSWSWNGAYPREWERARREWQGVLTRETLALLRAWDRVEGH